MSWYEPQPRQKPKRLPRRRPIKVVPSGIGDKGIVGNWLFYYLKGGDHLHDFSPYDNHGDIRGAKWVDGRYGWALDFDGVDDYVDIPESNSLDHGSQVTVSAWVMGYEFDSGDYDVFYDDGAGLGSGLTLYWHINGHLTWLVENSTGSYEMTKYYNVENDTWYHLVGTYDGSEMKFFVNGDLKDSTSQTGNIMNYDVGSTIGRRADWGNYHNGKIDEVRIYNRALSSSEIQAYYNRTKGIFR